MAGILIGSPPKPGGFETWQDYAAQLADWLELQGSTLFELSLTGLAAVPTVLGYQQTMPGDLATPFSLTVPPGTVVAFIQVELQQVRWLDNGSNPSATLGNLLDTIIVTPYAGDFTKLKFMETFPSAIINVEYRR